MYAHATGCFGAFCPALEFAGLHDQKPAQKIQTSQQNDRRSQHYKLTILKNPTSPYHQGLYYFGEAPFFGLYPVATTRKHALNWIFGELDVGLDNAPRDTRLRRAVPDHLATTKPSSPNLHLKCI